MVQEFRRRSTLHYRKLTLLGREVSCHLGKDMLLSISEDYRNFKFSNNVTCELRNTLSGEISLGMIPLAAEFLSFICRSLLSH